MMKIPFNRTTLVSVSLSLIGIALVVRAVFLMAGRQTGNALIDAGLGLSCCIWAFVPYQEFFRVASMPMRLDASPERDAYAKLYPAHSSLLSWAAMLLMVGGFVWNVIDAFR